MTDSSLRWRTSSFSSGGSACVEVAQAAGGGVLVRNSNHRDAGTLSLGAAEMAAWIAAARAGDLDDVAG